MSIHSSFDSSAPTRKEKPPQLPCLGISTRSRRRRALNPGPISPGATSSSFELGLCSPSPFTCLFLCLFLIVWLVRLGVWVFVFFFDFCFSPEQKKLLKNLASYASCQERGRGACRLSRRHPFHWEMCWAFMQPRAALGSVQAARGKAAVTSVSAGGAVTRPHEMLEWHSHTKRAFLWG